jgi:hypothetical protein
LKSQLSALAEEQGVLMSNSQTPFVETEFLLAVMEEDYEKAGQIAADMFPGERRKLRDVLEVASSILLNQL